MVDPMTSRLFHSIVIVGLGTTAGGCGTGEAAAPVGPSNADSGIDSPDLQVIFTSSPDDAAPDHWVACCGDQVSCAPPGSDAGPAANRCCWGDGGAPPACCLGFNFACVPRTSPAADAGDGGDAGTVCGCWPMFV
jgi:hypothetical protein